MRRTWKPYTDALKQDLTTLSPGRSWLRTVARSRIHITALLSTQLSCSSANSMVGYKRGSLSRRTCGSRAPTKYEQPIDRSGDIPIIVLTHEASPRGPAETQEHAMRRLKLWIDLHDQIAAMSIRGKRFTVDNAGHYIQCGPTPGRYRLHSRDRANHSRPIEALESNDGFCPL